jgi:serine/threonine protein kinase
MKLQNMQLGAYKLISLIGRGGMAQVWLANQLTLNREVAIKIISEQSDTGDESRPVERFAREAQSVARLDHPNILPVIDYGSAEGYLYLVMPYVRGGSLQERIKREPLVRAQAFEIFEQVLNGLAFAHRQGIIHRDLKPANILLYPDGRTVIADFGVAKALNDDVGLTQTGLTVGSPEYMAPEQFMGRSEYRSDLYSMGVILYRLLTGRTLYIGTNTWEIGMRHLNDPLPLPNPFVPPPLEAFLTKALHKRPEERFANAEEMGAFLHWAVGQLSPAELQVRPTPSSSNSSSSSQPPIPSSQSQGDPTRVLPTPSEVKRVGPDTRSIPPNRYDTPPSLPRTDLPSSDPAQSSPSAVGFGGASHQVDPPAGGATPPIPPSLASKPKSKLPVLVVVGLAVLLVAAVAIGLIFTLSSGSSKPSATSTVPVAQNTPASNTTTTGPVASVQSVVLTGHTGPVNVLSWSNDGRFFVTASDDKTLRVWDAATNQSIATFDDKAHPNKDAVLNAVWSADGQYIVAAVADKYVRLYEAKTGTVLVEATDGVVPRVAAIAPDDNLIPYPGPGVLHTWSWKNDTNGPDFPLGAPNVEVTALAFSPDSKYLAIGLSDSRALVWDVAAIKLLLTIPAKATGSDPVTALAWTPDSKQLAVGRQNSFATHQLDLTGGSVTAQPINQPVKARATSLTISSDGTRLAVGNLSGAVELWSLENNKQLRTFSSGPNNVIGLRWSEDNSKITVVSGGAQPQLSLYPATVPTATGASLTIKIDPMSGTKVTGTGVITDNGDGTVTAVLNISGLDPGSHHTHIHEGTCQAQGPIKYSLNDLVAGPDGKATSTTIVSVDFATVTAGNLYFNVHNEAGTPTYVAGCGIITT